MRNDSVDLGGPHLDNVHLQFGSVGSHLEGATPHVRRNDRLILAPACTRLKKRWVGA